MSVLAATAVSPELSREAVFRAISDPNRRTILDLLCKAEMAVKDLVGRFDISQPAVSQHLKILEKAGLVACRKAGRRRLYRLCAEPLRHVYDWVGHYEVFWDDHLDRLGQYLDEHPLDEPSSLDESGGGGDSGDA